MMFKSPRGGNEPLLGRKEVRTMKAVYWFTIYLLMGIWSAIAPHALNFTENTGAFWSSLLV
jgi:hypothetical protein